MVERLSFMVRMRMRGMLIIASILGKRRVTPPSPLSSCDDDIVDSELTPYDSLSTQLSRWFFVLRVRVLNKDAITGQSPLRHG